MIKIAGGRRYVRGMPTGNLVTDNREIDVSDVADLKIGVAWSRLVVILKKLAEWHTNKNGMAAVGFDFCKVDGRLVIGYWGGDELTRGMIDLILHYANRVDEDGGLVVSI